MDAFPTSREMADVVPQVLPEEHTIPQFGVPAPTSQAPGTSVLVLPLHAQAGTYPATGTWFSKMS